MGTLDIARIQITNPRKCQVDRESTLAAPAITHKWNIPIVRKSYSCAWTVCKIRRQPRVWRISIDHRQHLVSIKSRTLAKQSRITSERDHSLATGRAFKTLWLSMAPVCRILTSRCTDPPSSTSIRINPKDPRLQSRQPNTTPREWKECPLRKRMIQLPAIRISRMSGLSLPSWRSMAPMDVNLNLIDLINGAN